MCPRIYKNPTAQCATFTRPSLSLSLANNPRRRCIHNSYTHACVYIYIYTQVNRWILSLSVAGFMPSKATARRIIKGEKMEATRTSRSSGTRFLRRPAAAASSFSTIACLLLVFGLGLSEVRHRLARELCSSFFLFVGEETVYELFEVQLLGWCVALEVKEFLRGERLFCSLAAVRR